MDIFMPNPVKINSDALFAKFLEDNKNKIPKDVIVERVVSSRNDHVLQNSCDEGIAIHAFTLSLGLYLPLNPLISEILSRLGLAPIQLGPNCWRVMFGILALNQHFCKIKLGWKEFCYCYLVKRNAAGFYYFSPRHKRYALVTDIPHSEKGWKDAVIYLKGNWRGAGSGFTITPFPTTENTSGVPAGAKSIGSKPQDWGVNIKDLEKAWSFGQKNWRYLLDPANWGNDGEQVTQITNNNGAAGAGSSMLTEAREEVTCQGVISSLENIDKEVVEQPGQPGGESLADDELRCPQYEMTTNVPSPSQPPSKKQKTIHDLGSGGVAHDHHIMNLESTPATRASSGQEAAGDLTHQILPDNHSHYQSSSNPPSITPRDGIEFVKETMNNFLRFPVFSAECKSDDEFGHLEKAIIELLRKKSIDEAGFRLARLLLVMVELHLTSIEESQDSKNKTIKELEASNERLEKDMAGLKQTIKELEATNESLEKDMAGLKQTIKELEASNESLEKDMAGLKQTIKELEATNESLEKKLAELEGNGTGMEPWKSATVANIEIVKKSSDKMMSWLTEQITNMNSHGQINEPLTLCNQLQGQSEPLIFNQLQNETFACPPKELGGDQRIENCDEERAWCGTQPQDQGLQLSLSYSRNQLQGQNETSSSSLNVSDLLRSLCPPEELGGDRHIENCDEERADQGLELSLSCTRNQLLGQNECPSSSMSVTLLRSPCPPEELGGDQRIENCDEERAWCGTQPQDQGLELSLSYSRNQLQGQNETSSSSLNVSDFLRSLCPLEELGRDQHIENCDEERADQGLELSLSYTENQWLGEYEGPSTDMSFT